jgi:hypothetical protein
MPATAEIFWAHFGSQNEYERPLALRRACRDSAFLTSLRVPPLRSLSTQVPAILSVGEAKAKSIGWVLWIFSEMWKSHGTRSRWRESPSRLPMDECNFKISNRR